MRPIEERASVGCAPSPVTAADSLPPWERVKASPRPDERPLPKGFEGCVSGGPELSCYEGSRNRGAW